MRRQKWRLELTLHSKPSSIALGSKTCYALERDGRHTQHAEREKRMGHSLMCAYIDRAQLELYSRGLMNAGWLVASPERKCQRQHQNQYQITLPLFSSSSLCWLEEECIHSHAHWRGPNCFFGIINATFAPLTNICALNAPLVLHARLLPFYLIAALVICSRGRKFRCLWSLWYMCIVFCYTCHSCTLRYKDLIPCTIVCLFQNHTLLLTPLWDWKTFKKIALATIYR